MRKVSILLCALLLVAALVPASAEGDVMTPYGKYPETVVLGTVKRTDANPNFVEGEDVVNNAMTKYVKDKVNVEMKVDWEVESTEFANKLSLMMAGGTLPDMFTLGASDYLLFKQLQENDMLADLKPGYDACANEYTKGTVGPEGSYGGRNLTPFYGDNGEMYAFAGGRYGYEHNQLWLRQDWLEAAGLEAPKTVEDIAAILRAWQANPPVENYTGLVLNDRSVGGVYDSLSASPIFASFHAYPNAWVKDEGGEIIWGSTAPGVKEALKVLADWYKEGLIDQQFVTRTASGAKEALITGGQSGAAFAPWWFVYPIGDFPKNNPDGEILPHNAPLDENGKFNITFPGAAGDYIMVRKDYPHPEAIFKVINCEFDMW
ncbi:MAG: extracellular solute-binding protein, partial [Clostridiales bacterium]|nr:extracellular solute-binding protein [Clostridiales bacterium]